MTRRISAVFSGFLITLFALLSFRSFAPNLSPFLNSDGAIHVLMSYDLQLPQDLYYWGQNRLGSLIPILTHVLLQITKLAPIDAISYVQYFVLIVGFLSLTSLFQLKRSKVLFGLVWFLPLICFTELIGIAQPYSPQFTMLGLSLVLLNQVQVQAPATQPVQATSVFSNSTDWKQTIRNHVFVGLATACLLSSLWISELSIVFLLLLLGQLLGSMYRTAAEQTPVKVDDSSFSSTRLEQISQQWSWRLRQIYLSPLFGISVNIAVVSLPGIWFIAYAKQNALTHTNYAAFTGFKQTQEMATHLWLALIHTLTFRSDNLFLSIHAGLVLVLVVSLSLILPKQFKQGVHPFQSRWLFLFAASALLSLLLLLPSRWVYINGISLRYFAIVYVTCWISSLLLLEILRGRAKAFISVLLSLIAITSSLSLPSFVFQLNPPVSVISQIREIKSLGKAGIIGEYWHSYILCTAKPSQLNCTSQDISRQSRIPCEATPIKRKKIRGVRCPRCAKRVLQAETIYLVKENWLASFPDEIQQFGQCLVRVGEPRQIANYTLAPYQKRHS
jgi:hypothetical protein